MAVILKRQLNDAEKEQILGRHGRKCFATGHAISEGKTVHFDHIWAFIDSGLTELNNLAPMCEEHNKQKGTLSLEDFRVKLRLEDFFSRGNALTLKHLLEYLKNNAHIQAYGQNVAIEEHDNHIKIQTNKGQTHEYELHQCPTTKWKYFYATLPIDVLNSDDEEDGKIGLQPRYLIFDKVFELYRHFQRHPVLQPSIGRVHGERIVLFDGQHKTAALLWLKRRQFECKIYVAPDLRLLNQTNISAHDKFAQTRFYASIMVQKLGTEFGLDFEKYKNLEDGSVKSESGFMKYLDRDLTHALTKGERNTRFRNYLYNSILENQHNKAAQFVSKSNRSSADTPLTIDMLSKSLFAYFLYREPVEDNMATDTYKRDKEIENNVSLMNMFYDLALGGWNPKAGPQDHTQRKLDRLFRSKSIMAWSELLQGAICGKLDLDDPDDRARPFYRELSEPGLERIRKVVERLIGWSMWSAPPNDEIDRILADNKEEVKKWFKTHGLTASYLMGAPE